jgi:hypothetical protein
MDPKPEEDAMRYDRGYGRDTGAGRAYDSGLRGFRDTAERRGPVPLRETGGPGYGVYRGAGSTPRVTQRYNREYLHPRPQERPLNHDPYGGDAAERIVDAAGYWRPYMTVGGTRTMRGGARPLGWEREVGGGPYDRGFRGYGRDMRGPMR